CALPICEEDFDIKEPALDIVINRLFGNLPDAPDGEVARFIMDIDLSSVDGSMDRSFELGDTDGDPGMAASHNPFIGIDHPDLDSNGYFDWSWSVRFFVPGIDDIDGDGVVDGTVQQGVFVSAGIEIAAPEGQAVQDPGGAWSWEIDTGIDGAGIGNEDALSYYRDDGAFGYSQFFGVIWFGGFDCSDANGPSTYTPYGSFYHAMYGPGDIDCCPADYNCDGSLDFFDVSAFIDDFNAMSPDADFNLDGAWDFFDVSLFIQGFTTGCP
ncbi:MAG: GC-type dockerin domain-anchored protein, partial [Phycisphaerales bacterium]